MHRLLLPQFTHRPMQLWSIQGGVLGLARDLAPGRDLVPSPRTVIGITVLPVFTRTRMGAMADILSSTGVDTLHRMADGQAPEDIPPRASKADLLNRSPMMGVAINSIPLRVTGVDYSEV